MTTLHITNGDAAGDTLREFVTGTVTITADPLHEGPAPAEAEGEAWRAVRANHLAESPDSYDDVLRWLTEWDAAIAGAGAYDEVVLWFEHDLFDQLLLIRTLDMLAGFGQTLPPAVSLICIGAFPGVERFVGLGQLNAEQLASLVDARQRVTARHYEIASETWTAFRSPDPTELLRLTVRLNADPTFEFLSDALKRFLEEYPSTRNGLSRSADAILQALIGGPLDRAAVFQRTQAAEARPFMGDLTLWSVAGRLAGGRVPLLTIDQDTFALTGAGRDVAAGRQDAVALNGIDEWRGGVRLQGRDRSPWRWDPGAETLLS